MPTSFIKVFAASTPKTMFLRIKRAYKAIKKMKTIVVKWSQKKTFLMPNRWNHSPLLIKEM